MSDRVPVYILPTANLLALAAAVARTRCEELGVTFCGSPSPLLAAPLLVARARIPMVVCGTARRLSRRRCTAPVSQQHLNLRLLDAQPLTDLVHLGMALSLSACSLLDPWAGSRFMGVPPHASGR